MKKMIGAIAIVLLTACGSQKSAIPPPPPPTVAPELEKVDVLPDDTPKMINGHLYGIQSKEDFLQAPFDSWFTAGYESFELDEALVTELKETLKDVQIKAFMGTWCGDSKRETPKFYKILDQVNFDYSKLTMVSVDRSKKKPEPLIAPYDIMRVPTFIFYRNGKELGRFVERPRETTEKDILKIVTGQPYKHYYDRS